MNIAQANNAQDKTYVNNAHTCIIIINNIPDIANDNNDTSPINQIYQTPDKQDNIQVEQELEKITSPMKNQESLKRKSNSSVHISE